MSTFQALELVKKIATIVHQEQESISREEITKKINEIKYLSAQKKLPKLTLRKEIIHLENKVAKIFEWEKKKAKEKKKESTKIAALKRQNTILKKKLAAVEDKDVTQKVEKLSHLIGDSLAKKEAHKDVVLAQRIVKQERKVQDDKQRVMDLSRRLQLLKHEFEVTKRSENANPEKLKLIARSIGLIESKLKQYAAPVVKQDMGVINLRPPEEAVKHEVLFHQPPPQKVAHLDHQQIQKDLPLPPPPKRLVRKR